MFFDTGNLFSGKCRRFPASLRKNQVFLRHFEWSWKKNNVKKIRNEIILSGFFSTFLLSFHFSGIVIRQSKATRKSRFHLRRHLLLWDTVYYRKKLFYIDLSSLQACRQSIFIFLVLTINFLSSVKAVELRCRISTAFSYAFNGRNSSVGEVGLPQEDDWWLWMCQKRLINVKTILFFQSWFWSYSYFS